jgi:hypothetical protein
MKCKLLCFLTLLTLFSCGKISHLGFFTEDQPSGKQDFILEVTINKSNYALPIFTLPIYDFNQGLVIGEIAVDSSNTITLRFDANILGNTGIDTEWNLPNGRPIPFIATDETKVFVFGIGNTNSRIYVSLDNDQTILGLALNIEELPPTKEPGGLNALLPYSLDQYSGVLGLYLGNAPGESGFAFFVNVTAAVQSNQKSLSLGKIQTLNQSPKREVKKVYRHVKEYLKGQDTHLY